MGLAGDVWNWVRTKVQQSPETVVILCYILLVVVVAILVDPMSENVKRWAALLLGVIGGTLVGVSVGAMVKPGNPYINAALGSVGTLGLDRLLEEKELDGLKAVIGKLKDVIFEQLRFLLPLISEEEINIWLGTVLLVGAILGFVISVRRWQAQG